jgi:hypothetical protein
VLYLTGYDTVAIENQAYGRILRKPIDDIVLIGEIERALVEASASPDRDNRPSQGPITDDQALPFTPDYHRSRTSGAAGVILPRRITPSQSALAPRRLD